MNFFLKNYSFFKVFINCGGHMKVLTFGIYVEVFRASKKIPKGKKGHCHLACTLLPLSLVHLHS